MREILFRGKSIDNGKWLYGDFLSTKHYAQIWVDTDDGKWNYPVDKSTVSQYTGLKDKNGVKIFEGDIVEVADDNGNTGVCDCGTGEVVFLDGFWYVAGKVHNSLYDLQRVFYISVIGNTHDNPELMEV